MGPARAHEVGEEVADLLGGGRGRVESRAAEGTEGATDDRGGTLRSDPESARREPNSLQERAAIVGGRAQDVVENRTIVVLIQEIEHRSSSLRVHIEHCAVEHRRPQDALQMRSLVRQERERLLQMGRSLRPRENRPQHEKLPGNGERAHADGVVVR
jgi:hypothetical protein